MSHPRLATSLEADAAAERDGELIQGREDQANPGVPRQKTN